MTALLQLARTLALAAVLLLWLSRGLALSEEAWRTSFDETCAMSNEAMTLSVGQLTTLIERCDALQKVIDTQEESVRKVFTKRLQLCKNLYAYVLEYKRKEQPVN